MARFPAPPARNRQLPRAIDALEATARHWLDRARQMQAAVDRMREKVREAEEAAGVVRRRGPGRPPAGAARPATRRTAGRAPRGQGAGAVAIEILREWARPARVNELLAEFEKRGVSVGGQRPYNTLTATLVQRKGVKRVGKGLFALEGHVAASATKPVPVKATRAKPRAGSRAPRGVSVGAHAIELLRAHGKPMGVKDLLVALGGAGVKVGGRRPSNTLTATLSRLKGLRRAGPGLYEVVGPGAAGDPPPVA